MQESTTQPTQDVLPAHERRCHQDLGFPNSVACLIAKANSVNFVNSRQWLAFTQFVQAFFFLVGHQ